MKADSHSPILRGALVIMLGIVASRLLGVVREIAFARVFGANNSTDAYFQAFRIPDFFYFLMAGGALAAGFVPAFSERLARGQKDAAWHLFRSLLTILVLLSVTVIGSAFTFSPVLALLVGKGFDAQTSTLCASLMRVILPAQIFFVVGGLFMGALNSFRAFVWSALAPGGYNIVIIASILFLGPRYGLFGVAWGVVAGAFIAQIVLQAPPLKLLGASFRPLWDPLHAGVKQVARLILPVTFGLCLLQINFMVTSVIATGLGRSSVSCFNFAFRIVWLPVGIFGSSLGVSLLPTLSAHAALNQLDELRSKVAQSLRLLFFVVLLPASLLLLLPTPIVRFLLQSGKFTASNTSRTAAALAFFAPTAVFTSLQQVVVRSFYALQRPLIPVFVGGASVVLCIVLSLLLAGPMELQGLALANSLSATINCCVLIVLLAKSVGGLEAPQAGRSILKSALSLLPAAAAVYWASRWCGSTFPATGKVFQAVDVMAPALLGSAVYLLAARLLRHPEAPWLFQLMRRKKSPAFEV